MMSRLQLAIDQIIFARNYYNLDNATEKEIRSLAAKLLGRMEWDFFQMPGNSDFAYAISMGWTPEKGIHDHAWTGYNEGLFLYAKVVAHIVWRDLSVAGQRQLALGQRRTEHVERFGIATLLEVLEDVVRNVLVDRRSCDAKAFIVEQAVVCVHRPMLAGRGAQHEDAQASILAL